MDVVLSPVGPKPAEWTLRDRLGRDLGTVNRLPDPVLYKVIAKLGCSLDGVETFHDTLDAVMSAVAKRMNGACSLDSHDWD